MILTYIETQQQGRDIFQSQEDASYWYKFAEEEIFYECDRTGKRISNGRTAEFDDLRAGLIDDCYLWPIRILPHRSL